MFRRMKSSMILTSVLSAGLIALGCSGGDKPEDQKASGGEKPGKKPTKPATKAELKPLEARERGTLKGKVTLTGTMPDIAKMNQDILKQIEGNKDKEGCLAGGESEKTQQAWIIDDATKGVANVFVWLTPPAGHYFKLDAKDLDLKSKDRETVTIRQPHCAFIPHVEVLFPSYRDPETGKHKTTGQKFIVKNDATFTHNTKWTPERGAGDNYNMGPGTERTLDIKLEHGKVDISCSIHPWMTAHVRVFDHPFATVTKADGSYEIPNVPSGVDLQVVAWHEKAGFVTSPKGETIKIDKETTKDFTIKGK